MNQNIKTHVSDLISYEKDIKPYKFIEIISGVGSGKSYFVEQLALKFKVLIITSRRAKVEETYNKNKSKIYTEKFKAKEMYITAVQWQQLPPWDRISDVKGCPNGLWVATNAQIEQYYNYKYDETTNPTTKRIMTISNSFDIVVLDECHSIFVDSTYQTSGYYVGMLLDDIRKTRRKICKHIICMTGTPEPCGDYFKDKYDKKDYIRFDLRNDCGSIQPENIYFIEEEEAKLLVNKLYKENKRVVYFINNTLEEWFPKKFVEKTNILSSDVTFICSKQESISKLRYQDEEAYQRLSKAYNDISNNGHIPDFVKILLTTSILKEGIDINDDDIDSIIVNNHRESDVIQMVGRFRNNIKNLYIIADTRPYRISPVNHKMYKNDLQDDIDHFNKKLLALKQSLEYGQSLSKTDEDYYSLQNYKADLDNLITRAIIDNPYIVYDSKIQQFVKNDNTVLGVNYCRQQDKVWENIKKEYNLIVSKWYNNSTIHPFYTLNERLKMEFDEYWDSCNIQLNIGYSKKFYLNFLAGLSELFSCQESIKRIDNANNKLAKVCMYRLKKVKRGDGTYYYFYNRYKGFKPKDYKPRKKSLS